MVSVSQVGIGRKELADVSYNENVGICRTLNYIQYIQTCAITRNGGFKPLVKYEQDRPLRLYHSVHCICLEKIDGFTTEIHIIDPPQSGQRRAAVSFRRSRKG